MTMVFSTIQSLLEEMNISRFQKHDDFHILKFKDHLDDIPMVTDSRKCDFFQIVTINLPIIDNGELSGQAQKGKMQLWEVLNIFRIVLPAYGLYKLTTLLDLRKS